MRKTPSLLLALALGFPAMLGAQPGGYRAGPPLHGAGDNERVVYADVLRVDPIYDRVQISQPREECYDAQVRRSTGRYENTNTGTIIGALVGGALGNQVGKGDGRRAATVAGAVIGGSVGRNVDASDNSSHIERDVETRCHVVESAREERQIVGYDVEFRYRGEVFVSRLGHDPGEKLRVRVSIEPIEP